MSKFDEIYSEFKANHFKYINGSAESIQALIDFIFWAKCEYENAISEIAHLKLLLRQKQQEFDEERKDLINKLREDPAIIRQLNSWMTNKKIQELKKQLKEARYERNDRN